MSDLDNVQADFAAGALVRASLEDGVIYPTPRTWNFFSDQWGWTRDQFSERLERWSASGFFVDLPPIPGSVQWIRAQIAAGHEVTFVTARPESAEMDTVRWLYQHIGRRWDLELVAGPKGGGHRFDLAVDDHAPNLRTLSASGCERVVLLHAPWNEADADIERVSSLHHLELGDVTADLVAAYSA